MGGGVAKSGEIVENRRMTKRGRGILGLGRNVFVAGLVSLFMDISSEMVYPLVPLFLADVLGVTMTAVGVIEGVAEATASLVKVVSGWLSDRLGRRKLLMALGYGVSTLSRPLIAGAGSWFEVLTARFIDRFGKGVRTAPRDAIIADSTEPANFGAAFGFHRAMDTVGAMIGPGAAFLMLALVTGNYRWVFLASMVPGAVAVLLILFFIQEKAAGPAPGAKPAALSISSFDGTFRRYILVIGIFSLGTFSDAFVILRAKDVGIAVWLIPVAYLSFNAVYALSSTPMGMLADRIGKNRTVLAGFVFYSALLLGFAASRSPWHIWALFALYGVYKGMSVGVQRAYLAEIAPPERKATAFGVYHMMVGLGLLPASVVAGLLWDLYGAPATFIYGAGMAALASCVFVLSGLAGRKVAI